MYTKGKWKITETLGQVAITTEHDSIGIAPYIVCYIWPHIKEGIPEANAHLISAAPELLEALKELSEACYHADANEELSEYIDGSLLDRAREAIAKATQEKGEIYERD